MTDHLHLSARHRGMIESILSDKVPGVEVWAYGSRVNGRSFDGSDLDLVLRAPDLARIPTEQLISLKHALTESMIPFLVEVRDWYRLPKQFHREIERQYVVLVPKKHDTS